jgi:HAD superfamily hydrolase (TIGR01509 family)
MIAVIFDLDGVLCDTPDLHYQALNRALEACGHPPISRQRHSTELNGLSTRQKLEFLDIIDPRVHPRKQEETIRALRVLPNPRLRTLITSLRAAHIKVGCASNCIRRSQLTALKQLDLLDLFDTTVCNEDVDHPKPAPDMYRLCMQRLGVSPDTTVIVEDSPIGVAAATAAGATVCVVTGPHDVTLERVLGLRPLHLIIPMAGAGSRFAKAGYTNRKPFIDVRGECMIQHVHRNLGVPQQHTTFVTLDEDAHRVACMFPKAKVVSIGSHVTSGTATTVRLALDSLQHNGPVMVANSDQVVECDMGAFRIAMQHADGGMLTFTVHDKDPKWSYAEVVNNEVVRVAEKVPISTEATAGVYYWTDTDKLCESIDRLVAADDRHNGEFYLCPTFNHLDGVIRTFPCTMHGIGDPHDLDAFHQLCTPQFISHRGNTHGPNPSTDNRPDVIERVHDELGCDVEIDVWVQPDDGIFLGHDGPQYPITLAFLQRPWLWCHAKNTAALQLLLEHGMHCFTHDNDDHTITSRGIAWTYPGQPLVRGGVAVKPEGKYTATELRKAAYVCSDYADSTQWTLS